jgi:hypothetical protein
MRLSAVGRRVSRCRDVESVLEGVWLRIYEREGMRAT